MRTILIAAAAVLLSAMPAPAQTCAEKFYACATPCDSGEKSAKAQCLELCRIEGEKCSSAALKELRNERRTIHRAQIKVPPKRS